MGDARTANPADWCCDGVLGNNRAMASKHLRTVLGIRLPGAQRVRPWLKWASAHFPQETKQILLSLIIICLTSSCKKQHALPFPSSVLGITVCNCSFIFSGSWNPSTESSCHGGLQQCHRDAAQWLCFIAFYRWSLPKKNQCKKHRVRMLPVVLN